MRKLKCLLKQDLYNKIEGNDKMMESQINIYGVDRQEQSIKFLVDNEPDDGYYLAFSGGKDSQCIYHLAQEAGVKFDAHYNITTCDPPELVNFIKSNYPDVIFDRPAVTMWQLIPIKLMPPTRKVRYCCEVLKEGQGLGRIVVTGVRRAESGKRSKRNPVEIFHGKKTVNPIVYWGESDVWGYIKSNNIEYCKLYDEGYKRLGCVLCPMASIRQRKIEAEQWPKIKSAYIRAFGRMLEERKKRKLKTNWQTAEEVYKWWLSQ